MKGLQSHIKALNSILPESFIFVLDTTDRSFVYNSSNCPIGKKEILDLDRFEGMESLMVEDPVYSAENTDHTYMIKRFSNHLFFGFFVLKDELPINKIDGAKNFFLKMAKSEAAPVAHRSFEV